MKTEDDCWKDGNVLLEHISKTPLVGLSVPDLMKKTDWEERRVTDALALLETNTEVWSSRYIWQHAGVIDGKVQKRLIWMKED